MKKEALEVLKNRRSIRKFQSRQISAEELDTVLEAGTYAPTAGGRQAPGDRRRSGRGDGCGAGRHERKGYGKRIRRIPITARRPFCS